MNAYEFLTQGNELVQSTQQLYHDFAKENGVNYNVLAVLYTCSVNGGCTQKKIATEWQLPKQTVNSVCKELLESGILQKERSGKDHRETKMSLTEKGEKVALPVVNKLVKTEERILERLGQEKAKKFLKIYLEIRDVMVEEFTERK